MRRPARLERDIDTWQRHAITARLLEAPDRVLDVGGVPGRLAPLLPGTEVVTANVEAPADLLFDGLHVPCDDSSFEAVTSIDVLEHLPPAARPGHLAELTRVARRRVVLCCPLGSPEHERAERELADWYGELAGERDPYLDEHLANGLPTKADLGALIAEAPGGLRFELRFNGDLRRPVALYRARALAHFRRRPSDRAAYLLRRLAARPDLAPAPAPAPFSNRAFLVGRAS